MKSDPEFTSFDINVDGNLHPKVKELYEQNKSRWLGRLVAERARLFCQDHFEINDKDLERQIERTIGLSVVVAGVSLVLIMILHAVGTTSWLFLSSRNVASIGNLMWLLIIPPLLCVLPLIGCVTLLLTSGRKDTWDADDSYWLKTFRHLSVAGILLGALRLWQLGRRGTKSRVEEVLIEVAEKHDRTLTVIYLAASSLFVFLLSIAVAVAVTSFLLFNEVNFSWESSLLRTPTKVWVIDSLFGPFLPTPSEAAVEWAFGPSNSQASQADSEANAHRFDERYRQEWSIFLLSGLAVFFLLPRAIVLGFCLFLLWRCWVTSIPLQQDSQIKQLVESIFTPPTLTASTSSPLSCPPKQPPSEFARRRLLVAIDLTPEDREVLQQLDLNLDKEITFISGTRDHVEFLEQLSQRLDITNVALFVRATAGPDAAFQRFAKDIAKVVGERSGWARLVVTDVDKLMKQVDGDKKKYQHRIGLWKRDFHQVGRDDVLEFDLARSVALEELVAWLRRDEGVEIEVRAFDEKRSPHTDPLRDYVENRPERHDSPEDPEGLPPLPPDTSAIESGTSAEADRTSGATAGKDTQSLNPPVVELEPEPKPRRKARLLAIDLAPEAREVLQQLDLNVDEEITIVGGARDRRECLEQLSQRLDITDVALFVRATVVPDAAFRRFAENIAKVVGERSGSARLIVTDVDKLLRQVDGDRRRYHHRINLWKHDFHQVGGRDVLEFDLARPVALEELVAWLHPDTPLPTRKPAPSGKFKQALREVRRIITDRCSQSALQNTDFWAETLAVSQDELNKTYTEERVQLLKSLDVEVWRAKSIEIAKSIDLPDELKLPDRLAAGVASAIAVTSLFRSLSPAWISSGAVAGIGLSALPLIPFGLAAVPLVLSSLPLAVAAGGIAAQVAKSLQRTRQDVAGDEGEGSATEMPDYHGFGLDKTVRTLILEVLLLEFQSYPQDELLHKVEFHTAQLCSSPITSIKAMISVTDELESSLSKSKGDQP
jgi:flagellar motor protein MotB